MTQDAQDPATQEPAAGARHEPRGRLFDEYSLGETFVSPRRTVTEADIAAFASLSGDFNPLHVDEVFASRTPHRGRIAHGMLAQSIATGLGHELGIFSRTIVALGEMRLKFVAPVRAGDTLRLELTVAEIDADPGPKRGRVRFSAPLFNQDDQRVIDGEWTVVVSRRAPRG